jgi:hypothetical protein
MRTCESGVMKARRSGSPSTKPSKLIHMKNLYLAKIFGLGTVLAFALSLSLSAFAGPGPQYWTQMAQIRAESAAKPAKPMAVVPVKPADRPAMACPHCQTKVVEEFSFTNVSGKLAPHMTVVGKSHSCEGCSGVVTIVRGKVTDDMKVTCPICTEAGRNCCVISNKVARN